MPLRPTPIRRDPAKADDEPSTGSLPIVPITDLVVHGSDLVVATQGRGFWILDDVTPLRQASGLATSAAPRLLPLQPAYRFGGPVGRAGENGLNPPPGALIYYALGRATRDSQEVTLEIVDPAGRSVRKFSSKGDPPESGEGNGEEGSATTVRLPARAGLNRFAWNLRHTNAKRFKGLVLWGGGLEGPQVGAGRYAVRLVAGGDTIVDSLEVRRDPRLSTPEADDRARYELLLSIRDELTKTHESIERLREARDQVKAAAERAKVFAPDSSIARAAEALVRKLTTVEEALYQTKNRSSQDPLNYPIRLNNKLSALGSDVADTEGRPTSQQQEVHRDLVRRIDIQLAALNELLAQGVTSFNRLLRDREVPAVVVKGVAGAKPSP